MRAYIVRHARAEKRVGWDAPDALRPLTPLGLGQARALAEALAGERLERIVSSPLLRCTQTLEPLAEASGLRIEVDERLAVGGRPTKVLELLEELDDTPVALCSHGDVIPGLLYELESRGVHLETDGRLRCQKGSVWFAGDHGDAPLRATYLPVPPPEREHEDDRQRVAVLDLGSTSFRGVVFEATRAGRLTQQLNERIMLRLGAALDAKGRIPRATCEEAVATARRLRKLAKNAGAERILPVATAAVRDAANGADLAAEIGKALGEEVRVLTGVEEARLLFLAFQRRVVLPADEPTLGVDLGGGSLELAIGNAREIHWEATLPIGVARLHRELVDGDPIRKSDTRRIRERLLAAIDPHLDTIADFAPETCIAAGGTARAFARIALARRDGTPHEDDPQDNEPVDIPVAELAKLTRRLARADHDERVRIPGVRRNRADLLPTGGILLDTLAETLGVEAFTVCDWGLREGVALRALGLGSA